MSDKNQIVVSKQQKSNKEQVSVAPVLNKIFGACVIISFLLLCYFIYNFFSVYLNKNEEIRNQGRIILIDTKTNKLELTDISESEIKSNNKSAPTKISDEIIGPQPKKDELMGPKPLQAELDANKKKMAENEIYGPLPDTAKKKKKVKKIVDYKTSNLAIVITEIGMKQSELDNAKDLPSEVTFAFSPYADQLQAKIDSTVADGRQVLLNIMMQPSSFPLKDNGSYSIQANYDESQNIIRFKTNIAVAKRYTGLLANNDEIITSKLDKFAPIMKKVSEMNSFIGYFKTTNNLNVENDAKPLAADIFGVDYLIDENPTEEAINKELNLVKEDILLKKRKIVIALRPYPTSINAIKKWLDENAETAIQLAPISYFVKNN